MNILERLAREERVARRDAQRLIDTACSLSLSMHSRPVAQLRVAAALADHPGELGYVGRSASAELRRRGL